MNPPNEANALPSVPIKMWHLPLRLNCSSVPLPVSPSVPVACASSSIKVAPYRSHISMILGSGATEPSVENTDSVTTKQNASSGTFFKLASNDSGSLCLKIRTVAPDRRIASISDAWLSLSDRIKSPFRQRAQIVPMFV